MEPCIGPKPVESKGCRVIKAGYHPIKHFSMDEKGYWLIRINPETKDLEVGHCKKNNIIEIKIIGKTAEQIYNTIIREGITTNPQHCGYLGKELEKAEIAKRLGIPYVQDAPLDLKKFMRNI